MRIYKLDDFLFQSSTIDSREDVRIIKELGIRVGVDLTGNEDKFGLRDILDISVSWPIWGSLFPSKGILWSISILASQMIGEGFSTLVHCAQGKDQSGLVCGLILKLGHPDWTGKKVVEHIRSKNPEAVFNPMFLEYLEELN